MEIFTFYLIPSEFGQDRKRVKSHVFRGILMEVLRKYDPELVNRFHQSNEIRPYAISYRRNKDIKEMLEFNITSLIETVSQRLLDSFLKISNQALSVQGEEYILSKIKFEKVEYKSLMVGARRIKKFQIRFLSPTYFTLKGKNFDLKIPTPEHFFGNLGALWNTHVSQIERIPLDELIEYVKSTVWLSSYDLKTRFADIGKAASKSGCVGWANYLVEEVDNPLNSWLDILLKFGEYSNVGGNRTAGLGVICVNLLELQ